MPAKQPMANSLQANALCEFAGTSSIARRCHQLRKMKRLIIKIIILLIIGLYSCEEQNSILVKKEQKIDSLKKNKEYQEVFNQIKTNDSLLFELGFNKCDTNQIRLITSDNFEFYHDQSGITNSKEFFIQSISELCKLDYKPTRELDKNSMEIHLLRDNGKVYGAIQNGVHKFYGEEENRPKYLTSTAEFTHLWIIEEGIWKLRRVLSYNHEEPENE